MRAVPVDGQLTAHPPKQRTRTAGSVPRLKEMPHISNISNVSNRYSGCEVLRCFWSGATVSILQKVSYRKYLGPVRSRLVPAGHAPCAIVAPLLRGRDMSLMNLKKTAPPSASTPPGSSRI